MKNNPKPNKLESLLAISPIPLIGDNAAYNLVEAKENRTDKLSEDPFFEYISMRVFGYLILPLATNGLYSLLYNIFK